MRPFKMILRMLAVLTALHTATGSAGAQTPLGGGVAERPLSVIATASAGYDTDITAAESAREPGIGAGAAYAGSVLAMTYSGGAPELNYYTSGQSQFRYFNAEQAMSAPLVTGSAGIGAQLGRRLRVNGSLSAGYFPQFQFSVLPPTTNIPIDLPRPSLDYSVSRTEVASYQGTAMATLSLSNRSTLNAHYGHSRFQYVDQAYRLNTNMFGGGYSRTLTRYATLQLAYSEHSGDYVTTIGSAQPRLVSRNINAGINYSRPLSLSRRTTVSFSTGSNALDNGNRTYYTMTGNAMLNHRLARRWDLGLAYSRQLSMVGGFNEPIFADSIALNLNGSVWERVIVSASTGYSNGKVGLDASSRNYQSAQSTARIEVPLARRLSFFGDYTYYRNLFNRSVVLPEGVPAHINRHGASIGLTFRVI